MNLENQNINWNSSDILLQIVKNIEAPLASIIEANKHNSLKISYNGLLKEKPTNIIFSNSQEIKRLIDEVVKIAQASNTAKEEPVIFKIYHANNRVQLMCSKEIDPKKISKQDASWLLKLENEVYKNIDQKDLNLYDLSYSLSVSERQLYRKIKNLVHLTPNKYIRVLRLYKAKQFIDNYLYDTVSQISFAVGYYDTHYFSKLFNQQHGVSPKELLNNLEY
ncbi:helix-turn-helix transcriptional regulator [Polaribacter sp. Q13]|uniref:helix-turn-helix transcriptional regulator n=1 Tax=Polaribacter sp. Q13 TaxID=2806551 RepID=UPI00193B7922|nr:helix-turn-helix transcriptional regulator [Polaribacter sp. Q13]QVY64621.1 helix-turn-helix transcriptional regulator [Polaribacter sp. Q13]